VPLTPPPTPPGSWFAEVAADRAYFDRGSDGSVVFPMDSPPRFVTLAGARTLIGRRSQRRGVFPDIDLSQPPEDIGVSRSHALLEHPGDGRITVTDLGSANGTWIGDDLRPVPRGVAVPLATGARIYLGSWTRITLHAH
jgi:pSer/pThr/pTyr-binding forkhead associated (FHA) protein